MNLVGQLHTLRDGKINNMKVMICASVSFAAEMLKAKKILEGSGHTVLMTDDVEYHTKNPQTKLDINQELEFVSEQNFLDEGLKK